MRTSRRRRRRYSVRTVVSCSSHPLLELAELGEGVSVLRPVGELFGGHDRVQAGDADLDPCIGEDPGIASQIPVAARRAVAVPHLSHDVEVAGVGAPVAEAALTQNGVYLHGKCGGFLISETTDSQASIECTKGAGQPEEVVLVLADQTVAVFRGSGGAVGPGGVTADDEVLDAVAVEDFDDPGEVRLGGRRQGPSPSRPGASWPPGAWRALRR